MSYEQHELVVMQPASARRRIYRVALNMSVFAEVPNAFVRGRLGAVGESAGTSGVPVIEYG